MYVAGPLAGPGPEGAPLRLSRVLSLEVPGRSEASLDPDLRVFAADLARPYGLALREEALIEGRGHAFTEMGEQLIRQLVPAEEPVDLLILVFAVPDVQPGRAASVYLSSVCPGQPLAFALCDQGAAGAFSALRIAREYLRSGDCRRALVLIAEQAELHYEPARPTVLPDRHTIVGLLCTADGAPEVAEVRERTGVDAQAVGPLLAELWQESPRAVAVLGPGLAAQPEPTDRQVTRARAGAPFTGIWSELARGLPGWREQRLPVLLAEYDADLGYLCSARLDPVPAGAAAAGSAGAFVPAESPVR